MAYPDFKVPLKEIKLPLLQIGGAFLPSGPSAADCFFVWEGDSITFGLNLSAGQTWPEQAMLGSWFAGRGTRVNVAVSGSGMIVDAPSGPLNIPGRYTANVYPYRPGGASNPDSKPAYLFLLVGINDIQDGHSATEIMTALEAYWSQAQADGFTVIACTVMPYEAGASSLQFTRQQLNALISESITPDSKIDFAARMPDSSGATFTADATTNVFTITNHGLLDGMDVILTSTGTLPAPLTAGPTIYFVRDVTTSTFKIAATSGGAAIDITTAGTGVHTLNRLFQDGLHPARPGAAIMGEFANDAMTRQLVTDDISAQARWKTFDTIRKMGIGTDSISGVQLYIKAAAGDAAIRMDGGTSGDQVYSMYYNGTTILLHGVENAVPTVTVGGTLANAAFMATTTASPLQLGTNNAIQLTILSGGNVGIGTTAPSAKLHIVASQNSILLEAAAAVNSVYQQFQNGTAVGFIGAESSTPGNLATGTLAYAMVLASTASGKSLQLGTAGTIWQTISSAGATTFGGSVTVPDDAYDATTWNANLTVPTKNAVRDKIETLALSGAVTASGLTMSTARLLGRSTASTGAIEEIALGTGLSFSGTTLNATAAGATTALDNLASVAINAALVLGTSDAFALGSTTKMWSDLFLASGAVINFNAGDVLITHSANTLTFSGASTGYMFDANVGIGTTSPGHFLNIHSAGGNYFAASFTSASIGTSGNYVGLLFGFTDSSYQKGAIIYECIEGSGNGRGRLHFALNNAASSASAAIADARLSADYLGNVKIGGTADRGTTVGTNHLDIYDGTNPAGTLTNGISIYSNAGEGYMMDAAGNATLQTPHDSETNEWIFFSRNTQTRRVLRIEMERLMKALVAELGHKIGNDYIQDYIETV